MSDGSRARNAPPEGVEPGYSYLHMIIPSKRDEAYSLLGACPAMQNVVAYGNYGSEPVSYVVQKYGDIVSVTFAPSKVANSNHVFPADVTLSDHWVVDAGMDFNLLYRVLAILSTTLFMLGWSPIVLVGSLIGLAFWYIPIVVASSRDKDSDDSASPAPAGLVDDSTPVASTSVGARVTKRRLPSVSVSRPSVIHLVMLFLSLFVLTTLVRSAGATSELCELAIQSAKALEGDLYPYVRVPLDNYLRSLDASGYEWSYCSNDPVSVCNLSAVTKNAESYIRTVCPLLTGWKSGEWEENLEIHCAEWLLDDAHIGARVKEPLRTIGEFSVRLQLLSAIYFENIGVKLRACYRLSVLHELWNSLSNSQLFGYFEAHSNRLKEVMTAWWSRWRKVIDENLADDRKKVTAFDDFMSLCLSFAELFSAVFLPWWV